MRSVVTKIINVISVIIIVAAVGILLSVVMTKPGQAPDVFGYSFFRVVTGSMEPTLRTDSMVVVKHVEPEDIKVDDIISFYSQDQELQGAINTHRVTDIVVENGDYYYETKGDANALVDDDLTPADYMIGRMVFKSYPLGVLVRLIVNPLVFFPVIVIPLAVIIIVNLVTMIKSAKKLAKEEEEAAIRQALEELKKNKADTDDRS